MTFNIAANTYQPNLGKAALGGFKAGQDMRTSALQQQSTQQKMQQSALKSGQEQEDRQTQQMGAQANAVTDQVSYDRFRNWMKESLGETDAGLEEDGLTPEYNESVASVLKGKIDYTLGHQRFSGETNKPIAKAPYAPAKRKQLPMNFAKNFNERLAMDIGEELDELPKEDIKTIRDATSAKMREGADFEAAYTSTLQELGLQESGSFFGDEYELAPRKAAPAPEQIPTGQSINPPMAPEVQRELDETNKQIERLMQVKKQNRGGA